MTQLRMYVLLLAFSITRVTSVITSTSYQLQDDYQISNFASYFNFFTDSDPTAGYVDYVDYATAQSLGLYDIKSNQAYIGVDDTTVPTNDQRGRKSVRLESKNSYNHGLFILDLAHMPGDQCGSWPAFWMISASKPWPYGGEIDIIEGVNGQTGNSMTMHTDTGCSITKSTDMLSSSVLNTANCDIHASGQNENQGCNINSMDKTTYGSGFNAVGGGVYATEWNSDHIAMWFFPRASIPADIKAGQPNPGSSNWGLPIAIFQGGSNCDIDQHFVDLQIIFDITFCGQWAGQVWSTDSTCHSLASSCTTYVQNNPKDFTETYWLVNSLKVYQANGTAPVVSPTSSTTTTATSITSATTSSLLQTSTTPPLLNSTTSNAIVVSTSFTTSQTTSSATSPMNTLTTSVTTSSPISLTTSLNTSVTTSPTTPVPTSLATSSRTSAATVTTTTMTTAPPGTTSVITSVTQSSEIVSVVLITTPLTIQTILPATRSTSQSIGLPVTLSTSQPASQPTSQPTSQPASQPINQPTIQPAIQSTPPLVTQSQGQASPTSPGGWNPAGWWGWQSQARLAPTGGWRPNFGPPQ